MYLIFRDKISIGPEGCLRSKSGTFVSGYRKALTYGWSKSASRIHRGCDLTLYVVWLSQTQGLRQHNITLAAYTVVATNLRPTD